ncbi:MAG TPA: T9SS type A sorting domain-containing protein [Chitinophagaceae bacterium]
MKFLLRPQLKALFFLGGLILFSTRIFAQPANNECIGAIALTSSTSCINTAGTLNAATYTPPITGCGATNKSDVWYSFVAVATNHSITMSSYPNQIRLQLFSGSCGSLVSVACGNSSIAATGLIPGNTYFIRVYSQNNSTGTFNICVTHTGPTNDDCAGAVSLTSYTSCINTAGTLNLSGATAGLPAGCQPVGTHYDVWYSFVAATTTETVTISGLGANITNPRIQLYSGTCGSLTSVACGTTTITQAGLTIGNTYYVRVANLNTNPTGLGTVADFNICVTHTGPANDECTGAISLTLGSSCVNTAGTLVGATYTTIASLGCGVDSRNDVWYSFVAATTTSTVLLSSAPANSRIQVFSGTCGSLVSVTCGASSVTATGLTVGNTYYVRVYLDPNNNSASNTFNICVTNYSLPNDDCAGAVSLVSGNACSNTAGTLVGATVTAGLPAGCEPVNPHYDAWYKFVAVSTTETITISSLGAGITSSAIQLYSGTCGTLTSVACGTTTITQGSLTVGNTYYVRVSNVGSSVLNNGAFNICVTHTGVVNDLCAGAIMLTSGFTCSYTTGTTVGSTVTSGSTGCGGGPSAVKYDVWYSFVAQSTNPTITLNNVGANFTSPKIEIFSGSCAGSSVFCGNASPSVSPTLTIGNTYYIRVFSTNNPIPATLGNFDICITDPGPPTNDNCSGATSLSSATSCINIAGTLAYATSSSPSVSSTCSGTPGADVWYSFVAQSAFPTISLSSIGSGLGTAYIQILSGTCGAFTSVACISGTAGTLNLLPGGTGLTVGNTYYIRIYSPVASPGGSNMGFNICITNPATTSSAQVEVSKSYVNITKGTTGGSVEPGDILEIRATLVIRSGSIDSVAYYDTLEHNKGLTYEPVTLATKTNEGKVYKAFTDSYDSDAGTLTALSNLDTAIRIHIGRYATADYRGTTIQNTSFPRFYGSTYIVMATYQVQVYAAYDTKINWGGGVFTYKDGANMKMLSLKNDSLVVYISPGLCANAVSTVNRVGIENDGTFGAPSGSLPHARNKTASSAVPSYTFANFATGGGPQDYYYGITNNTSATYTTSNTFPKTGSVPNRVFNLWDITGDHTGATNSAKGNPPCDINQAITPGTNPCGYMLVVNAAYKTDTAFRSTITGLCPNTYYEISAWLKNICYKCGCDSLGNGAGTAPGTGTNGSSYLPFATNDSSGVQPNLAFQINGQDYYSTGNIPYYGTGVGITQTGSDSMNRWVKRGFVYKTEATQTSFELVIRNNAPGGGGNDWAIDDIVVSSCVPMMTYSPSLLPTVCDSNTLRIYDTVRSSYENYTYYKWQRSTDGGANWTDITANLGPTSPFWNGTAWEYVVHYDIPPANTTPADSADLYRMIVATTPANLGSSSCQATDVVNIITLNVVDCGIALKTDIISFSGKLVNEYAHLSWSTSLENEPVHFDVERSTDGVNFTRIATVDGNNNPRTEVNYYSFVDPTRLTGRAWYRITMVSKNARTKQSRIIQLSNSQNQFGIANVVNPFSNELQFDITTSSDGKIDVVLIDMIGKVAREKSYTVYSGMNSLSLENTGGLAPGMYILQVRNKAETITRKVIKK